MLVPTPNAMTDSASSIPATAMIKVGMPLATPYPLDFKRNRHGTTTAGDTAAIIDLERKIYKKKKIKINGRLGYRNILIRFFFFGGNISIRFGNKFSNRIKIALQKNEILKTGLKWMIFTDQQKNKCQK